MKLSFIKHDVSTSGMLAVGRATIKATPKIFDMFENSTYANKPKAILRELVANGVDAHTAAGTPDRPVEVSLPTEEDPTFTVRDFGIGMSQSFVMGPFMEYANGSTKDQSNDQIGGLGIGSKSPFSYVDQFSLRVVHDGHLSVYVMYKDSEGIPGVGLVAESPTTEHNGVMVSFAVQEEDIDIFRAAAQEALQYFRPLPLVENGSIHAPDYTFTGTNWALRPEAGELGVIMGGVRYPVVKSSLEHKLQQDPDLGPLLSYGLDLTLPIGSVKIATSREGLSYEAVTSEGIRIGLKSVVSDVIETFAHLFDNDETWWKAAQHLADEIGSVTNVYQRNARQQLLAANAIWRGQKLEASIDIKGMTGWRVWDIPAKTQYGRQRSVKTPTWTSPIDQRAFFPGLIEAVIVDDLPDSPKSKFGIKMQEYLATAPRAKAIMVLRTHDRQGYDQLLRDLGGPDVIYSSSFPEPAPRAKAASKAMTVRPRVRMFTFDGTRTQQWSGEPWKTIQPARGKESKEIAYAMQPSSGIMVVTDSFQLPDGFYDKMATKLIRYDDLHFVNKGDWDLLKDMPGWRQFDDVFKERLADALAQNPRLAEMKAVAEDELLSPAFARVRMSGYVHSGAYDQLTPAQLRKPFGKLVTLYLEYAQPYQGLQALGKFVNSKMPKGINAKALLETLENDPVYRIADQVNHKWGREDVDALISLI